MIQLDLDLRYSAKRCARGQQSGEGSAVDGGLGRRGNEVVGRFGLKLPRARRTRERGDQAVRVASAKEEWSVGSRVSGDTTGESKYRQDTAVEISRLASERVHRGTPMKNSCKLQN